MRGLVALTALGLGCGGAGDGDSVVTCDDQGVVDGNVELESQASIDALRGCTRIAGNLDIRFPEPLDLEPLSELVEIAGSLTVGSNDASGFGTLAGLESLREVGGQVELTVLPITDLSGLSGLEVIGSVGLEEIPPGLDISGCDQLASLAALESLAPIQRLSLRDNPKLGSLVGVELAADAAELTLIRQPLVDLAAARNLRTAQIVTVRVSELTSLADLSVLESVSNYMQIDAPDLESFDGLESLTSVAALDLENLGSLTDASGIANLADVDLLAVSGLAGVSVSLPRLTSLADSLSWGDNTAAGLEGFTALTRVGTLQIRRNLQLSALAPPALATVDGTVFIESNPQLAHDDAVAFAETLAVGGAVKIWNNLGSPGPLDPCPFTGDGSCDENGLCAEGTDVDDCSDAD